MCTLPPTSNGIFVLEGSSAGARWAGVGTLYGSGCILCSLVTPVRAPDLSPSVTSMNTSNGQFVPFGCCARSNMAPSSTTGHSPWHTSLHPSVVKSHQLKSWTASDSLPPSVPAMAALDMFKCWLHPSTTMNSRWLQHPSPQCGAVWQSKRRKGALCSGWGMHWGSPGNWPETWTVSVCLLCLVSVVSKHVCALHKQSLDFLQPCFQSHWFSTS